MDHTAVEELLKRCSSMYKLVVLATKRAKELAAGATPLVEADHKKITSIALEEICQGKIRYKGTGTEAATEAKKTKRGTKAKEKKRAEA